MLLGESSFLPSSIPAAGVEVLLLAMELTTFEEITHVSLVMKLFPLIFSPSHQFSSLSVEHRPPDYAPHRGASHDRVKG